jgi:hypothetical protein
MTGHVCTLSQTCAVELFMVRITGKPCANLVQVLPLLFGKSTFLQAQEQTGSTESGPVNGCSSCCSTAIGQRQPAAVAFSVRQHHLLAERVRFCIPYVASQECCHLHRCHLVVGRTQHVPQVFKTAVPSYSVYVSWYDVHECRVAHI